MELRGKYTLFAEGARGSLSKQAIAKYDLSKDRETQKFGIGFKELWRIPKDKHKAGLVQHSFGWPLDDEIEKLRMAFIAESDPKKQFALAEQVQKRVMGVGVTIPLGQYLEPMARRRNVSGNIEAPITVFWNVEKM